MPHGGEVLFGGDTAIHHPDALGLAILLLDGLKKRRQSGFVAGVSRHHLVGQRKTFRRDNQCDDHLHAIRALVTAITELPLVLLRKRRLALEIGAGQVVEQNIELRVEQILPPPLEMLEERRLVFHQQIMTFVKLVALGQLAKVGSEQIPHRALLEPLPVQTPFAARIDEPINAEGLQDQIPARSFPAGGQTLRPKFVQAQLFIQLTA